ncbi:1715_t:CDS:1, partial [Funneliformis caledonium]
GYTRQPSNRDLTKIENKGTKEEDMFVWITRDNYLELQILWG